MKTEVIEKESKMPYEVIGYHNEDVILCSLTDGSVKVVKPDEVMKVPDNLPYVYWDDYVKDVKEGLI